MLGSPETCPHRIRLALPTSSSGSINRGSVSAFDSAGNNVTKEVVRSSTVTGTKVDGRLKAGEDLEEYTIVFQAIMSTLDIFERVLALRVRDNLSGSV